MVNLEDFKRLEIKVAKVLKVEDHPNADKLYVLKVDWGEGERKLVAGIKSSYKKEELLNRQIIVLTNLEPANIRGIESQGMLLACQDDKGISALIPDRDVEIGSIVK